MADREDIFDIKNWKDFKKIKPTEDGMYAVLAKSVSKKFDYIIHSPVIVKDRLFSEYFQKNTLFYKKL